MQKLILILLLLFESIIDIKEKKVYVIVPGIYIFAMLLYQICFEKTQWNELILPVVGGIFMYGINVLTQEAIGKGDVWLIEMILVSMPWEQGFFCVMISFFLAALFSVGWFGLSKRRKKNISFPFAPFLCVGTMLAIGLEMGTFE